MCALAVHASISTCLPIMFCWSIADTAQASLPISSCVRHADCMLGQQDACAQVCWRGDNISVPFNVTRGAIPTPAAVSYTLTALAGNLTAVNLKLRSGHVSLASADLDGNYQLQIPVNWSAVPADAVYRWGLELQPIWLSQTPPMDNSTVAVHLFGVWRRASVPPALPGELCVHGQPISLV